MLVHREGAAPIIAGRRAHGRPSRDPRVLAVCAVVAAVVAGSSTLALMPDRAVPGTGEQVGARRVVAPPPAPPVADLRPPVVGTEQVVALPRAAPAVTPSRASAPSPEPTPTKRPRPSPSAEPAPRLLPDLDLADEVDEVSDRLTKEVDARGGKGRDRAPGGRGRGPKG